MPNPDSTGLADGTYFALAAADVKRLRGAKGDRARRDCIDALRTQVRRIDVGDAWWFLAWLGDAALAEGTSLHRGQMSRIELLDEAKFSAALGRLAVLDLRTAFFAIDEARFCHANVAFWVKKQWDVEGRTTVKDEHVFGRVADALPRLSAFATEAVKREQRLVFTTRF